MTIDVENALPFFADLSGNPMQGGQIYFGTAGQNPITSPLTIYWDAAATQPVAQPVAVANGLTTRNGTPARVYVPSAYSRLVLDSKGRQVSYDQSLAAPLRSDLAASNGASIVNWIQTGLAAVVRALQDKVRETVSVKDFGAKGDGITDDTASVQAAINALMLATTNPTGTTGNRGVGALYFPKGKYLVGSVTVGTQVATRPFGLVIRGDGEYATSLLYTSNAGIMFSFASYNSVVIEKLAIVHTDVVNIQANRAGWTNTCFNMDGTGGGRCFTLRNVTTHGFNVLMSYVGASNNDTNYFQQCSFFDGNTMIYSRNANAVDNHIQDCSIASEWNRVLDTGGFGHTTFQNCNIVISGVFLYLANANDSDQNSRYVIDNCKLEFYAPYNGVANATTQLIVVPVDFVNAEVDFRHVTFAGGKVPDPTVNQIDLGYAALRVRFVRCYLDPQMHVKITSGAVNTWTTRYYVRFEDCDAVPPPANVTFAGAAVGSVERLSVSYVRCNAVNDVTLVQFSAYSDYATKNVTFVPGTGISPQLISGAGPKTYDYSLYGQTTLVEGVTVCLHSKTGLVGGSVLIYSDAARTNLLATVAIADGTSAVPAAYVAAIAAGTVVTEGLFFTITNTNAGGGMEGKVALRYTNF